LEKELLSLCHELEEVKTVQAIKYDQGLGKQHKRLERHRLELDIALKLCVLAEAQEGELLEMQKLMTSMREELCHCNDPVCLFFPGSQS